MSTLDEVTRLMAQMTVEEKSKLLGLVVRDLGRALPGIASTQARAGDSRRSCVPGFRCG